MATPMHVVSSVEDFRNVFAQQASATDAFLFCYELPADASVTTDSLTRLQTCVQAQVTASHARLALYVWDCTSDAFADAKAQLNKVPGELLMLVVHRGAVADTLRGASLEAMLETDVPRVCERLAAFQAGAKPATVSTSRTTTTTTGSHKAGTKAPAPPTTTTTTTTTVRVDVAKMVALGRKLLSEGQPFYAEKFFIKALDSLDAVAAEVEATYDADQRRDYEGSVAMCLAWAAFSQLVQGKSVQGNAYLTRLTTQDVYARFRTEPLSDAMRVCATGQLLLAAPATWTGETCSQKKLQEKLAAHPRDDTSRSMLVITLFFSGDLERCLTEAVKLHVLDVPFGRVALKNVAAFLGEDHPLVVRLGPLRPTRKTEVETDTPVPQPEA